MYFKERNLIAHYVSDTTGELLFSEPYMDNRYRDDYTDAEAGLLTYVPGTPYKTYNDFLLEIIKSAF